MPTILVQDKSGAVNRIDVDKAEINVGRMKAVNDVVLSAANVSKKHARLFMHGDHYAVEDLNSTCGTFVNGSKITEPCILEPGDKVFVGDFVLEIEQPGLMETMAGDAIPLDPTPEPTPPPPRPGGNQTVPRQPIAWSAPPPQRQPVQPAPPEAPTQRSPARPVASPPPRASAEYRATAAHPPVMPEPARPEPARPAPPTPPAPPAAAPAAASADVQAVLVALVDVVDALHHIVTDGSKRVTQTNRANSSLREVKAALAKLTGAPADKK